MTFNKRFNAQRSAKSALGPHASEGIHFRTFQAGDGWTWEKIETAPAEDDFRPPAFLTKAREGLAEDEPSVLVPDLTPATHPIAAANAASWPTPPKGKRAAIAAKAKAGELPTPPDFSKPTHARFRAKLAKLIELAEAGDIDGLKAVAINPVSTSPRAMARYRDLAVTALEARVAR